jgi:hypothetical protein
MAFTYTEKEMNKIRLTQKCIDQKISIIDLSWALWCSIRTAYRYKATMKIEWPPWFIHGLKWKESNHSPNTSKYSHIDNIITKPKFIWFGPTFLAEKIEEIYGTVINKESLRQRMIKKWVWVASKNRNIIHRQKRERKPCFGMMIQFDWSYHDWLENWETKCLLCAVDDSTSCNTYAKFANWEWLLDVFEFRKEYFIKHWKPESIYIDRHSSYKVNHPQDQFDKEMKTRFQSGMLELWIIVIFAKSPEWKWRVERCFATHQDRLVKEMRLTDVKNYEDANYFLEHTYLPKYNSKFSVKPQKTWNSHKKLTQHEKENLERFFAKTTTRTVMKDWTIQYTNTKYQLVKWQILHNWYNVLVKESIYWKIKIFSWVQELKYIKLH